MREQPSTGAVVEAYARDAVVMAERLFNLTLDYSAESLQQLELILARLYNDRQGFFKRRVPEGRVREMALIWGGYLGEVIRRHWGGEWSMHSKLFSEPIMNLRIGETEIYPQAKVYKRLTNGPGEDVWFYYQTLSYQLGEAGEEEEQG